MGFNHQMKVVGNAPNSIAKCMTSRKTNSEDSRGGGDMGDAHSHLGRFRYHLGGGFKYFLFSPLLGEMIQFD